MAARFCPNCAHEVASTARFCPNCAAPLAAAPPPSTIGNPEPITGMDMAASKTRRLLVPAMVAALVVLAIAVAVLAGKGRQPPLVATQPVPAPASAPLVSAASTPPTSAPPLTNAPSTPSAPAPPLTNAPAGQPGVLPPDVAAYLTFLHGIDQRRAALDAEMSAALTQMMPSVQAPSLPDPGDENPTPSSGPAGKISQTYGEDSLKWQTLIRDFRAVNPPQSCLLLSSRYLTYLTDYTTIMSKMQVALQNGNAGGISSLQGAIQVATETQKQVTADSVEADSQLTQLCARYNAPSPSPFSRKAAARHRLCWGHEEPVYERESFYCRHAVPGLSLPSDGRACRVRGNRRMVASCAGNPGPIDCLAG